VRAAEARSPFDSLNWAGRLRPAHEKEISNESNCGHTRQAQYGPPERRPEAPTGDLVTIDFQALAEGGSMQAGAAFREKLLGKLELAPGGFPSAPSGG
jgi:hypothetical protein